MMKFSLTGIFATLLFFNLSAQDAHFCGADHEYHKLLQQHPELIQAEAEYEMAIQQLMRDAAESKDGEDEIFIIPVVFHVLHDYGAENIADAQIYDAINIMNRDNRKLNPDTTSIIPEFKDIASKTNIEYRLANIAPDGSCTNGINRIATYLTNDGSNSQAKFVQWPRSKYLNIWVVANMESGTAGFSMYPSSVNNINTIGLDGIAVRHNYVGSIGTSSTYTSRTLTHEAGHYLDLQHPWGSTNSPGEACGDDGVEDTPVTKGWTTCPQRENSDVCNPGIYENYQNYMDYSYCTNMFTEGQVARMRAALSSAISQRNDLVSPLNNINTGTANPEPTICQPKVDFYADKNTKYVCAGTSFKFHSQISNGTADTYAWSFPGADVETSNEANPSVTYSSPGWKSVTLTAGNASGSDTFTKDYAVYVFGESMDVEGQYVERFENQEDVNAKWISGYANENVISHDVNWEWSPVGCLEPGSMKLNIYDNPTAERYRFISPKLNLEGRTGEFISFKYAFATQGSPNEINVKLVVKGTSNCGAVENVKLTIDDPATILTAGNYFDVDFEPSSTTMWKTAIIEIGNSLAVDGMQLVFEVTSDYNENNFYIDDLNIGSSLVSTEDEEIVNTLNLYPNPAQNAATLDFTLTRPSSIEVSVYDLTGKKVQSRGLVNYATGANSVKVDTENLPNGVYILKLQGSEISKSMKLIIGK